MRSVFRFDELLSLGVATFTCSGVVGLAIGGLGHAPRPVLMVSLLFLAVAAGLAAVRRLLRRRARTELLSWLPATPAYATHRPSSRRFAKHGWGSDWEGLWSPQELSGDDGSGGLQVARSDGRDAATRAAVATLHQALTLDPDPARPPRPACRRARLRTLAREISSRGSRRRRSPKAMPGRQIS